MKPIETLEPRRLFAAGGLDTTYGGGDGTVDVRLNASGWTPAATDVAVDGSGRALAVGVYGGKRNVFSVARATADGAADATFGDAGIATVALPLDRSGDVDLVADARGRVLVMLSTSRGTTITRLTEAGAPDKKFGKNGTAVVPFVTSAADLAVDAANNVVVLGTSPGKAGTRGTVLRLTYRGRVDATFARGGVYKTSADYYNAKTGAAVMLRDDGRIVGVIDYGDRGLETFRLDPAGAPDLTYGRNGNGSTSVLGYEDDGAYNVLTNTFAAFRSDGSVIVDVSDYKEPSQQDDYYFDVIDADGELSTRVGGGERLYEKPLAAQGDGKLVIVNDSPAQIVRLNADLTSDASFAPLAAERTVRLLVEGRRALAFSGAVANGAFKPSVMRVTAIEL